MTKSKSRPTSFMSMPESIHCKIYSLLTIKQLMILKCVSKPISNFLDSEVFLKFITKKLNYLIQLLDSNKWLLEIEPTADHVRVLKSTRLEPMVPYVGLLKCVGTANGLICFSNLSYVSSLLNDKFVLWNPLTNYFTHLPTPHFINYDSLHSPCVCSSQ